MLRSRAATGPARLGFVSDVARLERFGNRPDQNGLALLITNEAVLWMPPEAGRCGRLRGTRSTTEGRPPAWP
jgi:hypothetical protein